MATKYEFAIKKEVLNSDRIIFTPVCRKKIGILNIFSTPWERITKVYDQYMLIELDFIPDLSYEECQEHIIGYQQKLLKMVENQVAQVEFHTLEEKTF